MTYDLLFSLVNLSVLPAWFMLIFLPRWSWTKKLVHSVLWPTVLGLVYFGLFIAVLFFGQGAEGGSFGTIDGVRTAFSSDAGLVMGWAHYLVFDLFIGAWIARDALRRGINHLMTVPCILFSWLFGPIGLLFYVILRKVTGKGGWDLADA